MSVDVPCVVDPCPDPKCNHQWLTAYELWCQIVRVADVLGELLMKETPVYQRVRRSHRVPRFDRE